MTLTAWAVAGAASAGTAATPRALSMQAAINGAVADNPGPARRKAEVDEASGQSAQARAAFLPHLSGQVSQSRERDNLKARGLDFSPPAGPGPGPALSFPSVVTYNRFQADVQLKQKVFDYSAWEKYQASKAAKGARAERVTHSQTRIAAQAERDYVATLAANRRITAAKSDVTLAGKLLDMAEHQQNVGLATGVDVARAKSRRAQSQSRLAQARTQRVRAAIALKRTIGYDLATPLKLTDKLSFQPVATGGAQHEISEALSRRASIRAAKKSIVQSERALRGARGQRLPTVSLQGAYGTAGNTPHRNEATTYRIGAQISIPLFDGGAIAARVDSAAARLEVQRINLRDARRQVEQNVRVARQTLKTLAAQVKAAQAGLRLAKVELDQARGQFRNGAANNIAVVDAQTSLSDARDKRVSALADYTRARITRATALGLARQFRLEHPITNE